MSAEGPNYEVLSPWAEADPILLKGLSPRPDDLAGKRLGLLCNNKRAAPVILDVAEKILKERYPDTAMSWFKARSFSVSTLEKGRKEEFDNWIQDVDAIVAAVGD